MKGKKYKVIGRKGHQARVILVGVGSRESSVKAIKDCLGDLWKYERIESFHGGILTGVCENEQGVLI